jgi:hypothetical protein
MVMVGIRDDDDGAFASGWALVHTGARYEDHGDHAHWRYKQPPAVIDRRVDDKQGNPAHLYVYDGAFYLANDQLNGYTRLDPSAYRRDKKGRVTLGKPHFIPGGGQHITLAVSDGKVGYATWIAGGGPHQGRVDVTPVSGGAEKPAYTFTLPTGAIHGAAANSGKVFFAPGDGVCWVQAGPDLKRAGEVVVVHHIPLGKDGDQPRRTGAFATCGPYVLFVTGKGPGSALVLLDARLPDPRPTFIPLDVKPTNRAVTPVVVRTAAGEPFALVLHDHEAGTDASDSLRVIDLDPNRDGDCTDAKIARTLPVGKSKVSGHYGHHAVAADADADGRWAFITNPGDGTIAALSLDDWQFKGEFKVGGTPTAVVAHGGRETDD